MIAAQPTARHTAGRTDDGPAQLPGWQQELAAALRDPVELLELLQLRPEDLGAGETAMSLRAAAALFPLRVPRSFVTRMRPRDPRDPLLLQVLPRGLETVPVPGFVADPLQELRARDAPGLLHKYSGRALLISTGACAVHCRYCFRRHYDYAADLDGGSRWSAALQAVADDAGIEELILSGGDPLSLGNARLGSLLTQAAALPQVRRLRIHTRTPIVLPSRVDAGLLAVLRGTGKDLVVVVHANHAAEIDTPTATALQLLRGVSTALLNQSVLLAGVNDDAATLAQLSLRLFESGVLPYYLHQLDRVAGAAHFEVADARAIAIVSQMIALLPGYLVPRLVREIPDAAGKTPLAIGTALSG